MSFKDDEVDTAKRFLIALGIPVQELLTLQDFARRDPDPNFVIEHLNNKCPDVVAISDIGPIGLELTAYTDDDSQNRLSAVLNDVYDAGVALAAGFPELHGFQLYFSPRDDNTLRRRDARPLVEQLFEFVRSEHSSAPFGSDDDRHYSVMHRRKTRNVFADWPLLDHQLRSVTVHTRNSFQGEPVELFGGFASAFGTRVERIAEGIAKKAVSLKKGYTRGLSAVWLVIHADGNPRSSRIAPMWPDEIERLLLSSASQSANESGFSRVFLWDGVRGGMVDFMCSEQSLPQQV
jgi:hypothetical protein